MNVLNDLNVSHHCSINTSCPEVTGKAAFSVTDGEVHPGIKDMEAMILECAKLDREINYFVDVVKQVTSEVNESNLAWAKTRNTQLRKHVYTH